MNTKFDIKIKLNQMIRGKIEEKNKSKDKKTKQIAIKNKDKKRKIKEGKKN
jgi:hypothetical protein